MSQEDTDSFDMDAVTLPQAKRSWRFRLIRWGFGALGVFLILGALGAGLGYLYLTFTLPKLTKLTDYKPSLVTEIFDQRLEKFAEYGEERRFLVEYEHIPKTLVHAFVSSEDANFFKHEGIDYMGIGRAFFKNIMAGKIVQGGSTITQQVAKSFLLSSERSYRRKIKEAFLAVRIEKNLSKEEILYLYLNQIYLGHGAYGVQSAAMSYFEKDVQDLTLAECALLAGLPQAPSRYSPFRSVTAAKIRQNYVLNQMLEHGYISEFELLSARNEELKVYARQNIAKQLAPDYAEHVRRYVQEKYGSDALYRDGLRIYTALDLDQQNKAKKSVRLGLEQLDQRQGYRGIIEHIDIQDKEARKNFLATVHQEAIELPYIILPGFEDFQNGKMSAFEPPEKTILEENELYKALILDFDPKGNYMEVQVGTESGHVHLEDMKWARNPEALDRFEENRYYVKDPRHKFKQGDVIWVSLKKPTAEELKSKKYNADITYFSLRQKPLVQGALVSLDPANGFVHAMVGGYDFQKSEFNRAFQSLRQPGSAFKPIVYASAIDKGYTASSIVVDSPIVYDTKSDEDEESFKWRPKNYGGKYHGDSTFRQGLVKSMNIITIKIMQDIGVHYAAAYARNLGISSPMNLDLSLALGSSDVTLLDLTRVYAIFAQGGKKQEPLFIKKIMDYQGNVLERHTDLDFDLSLHESITWLEKRVTKALEEKAQFHRKEIPVDTESALLDLESTGNETLTPEKRRKEEQEANNLESSEANVGEPLSETEDSQKRTGKDWLTNKERHIIYHRPPPGYVITPQTAYLITRLLQDVVAHGTGQRARALGRPVAGKTGTTNDEFDAWFMGFTPDIVTGVWVGFDQKKPLGAGETGSRAALPIWLDFMQQASEGTPVRAFGPPPNIVFATVSKETGLLATEDTPLEERIRSAYLEGTEPNTSEPQKSSMPEDQFFLIDSRLE